MLPNDAQALIAKVIFFMISFTMLCTLKAKAANLSDHHLESLNTKGKVGVVRYFE